MAGGGGWHGPRLRGHAFPSLFVLSRVGRVIDPTSFHSRGVESSEIGGPAATPSADATPIRLVYALADPSGKRGPRPSVGARCVAVFNGIEMDVIHVSPEIPFIANGVLPEALLPDAAQALARLPG